MTLRLNGDSSGFTEIKAADAAGDNSITLPTSNGSPNQLLQNSGTAGELQYTSSGGGLHYSGGRLLLGTPTARSTGVGFTSFLQVESAQTVSGCSLSLVSNRDISDLGPRLNFGRSKGGVVGSNTAVDDNAELGGIYFWGANGTNTNLSGASIVAAVDGDPASNSMPTRLEFATTSSGDASPKPRVQLRPTGEVALLQDCPGIDFSRIQTNLTGMDSETLDHYETGTFSPTIKGWNGTYSIQHGAYIKIGRIVHIMGEVKTDASTGDSVDTFPGLAGLPFDHAEDLNDSNSQRHMGTGTMLGSINITSGTTPIAFCTFDAHGSDAFFPNNVSGTGAGNFQSSFIQNLTTINFGYRFNCTYYS